MIRKYFLLCKTTVQVVIIAGFPLVHKTKQNSMIFESVSTNFILVTDLKLWRQIKTVATDSNLWPHIPIFGYRLIEYAATDLYLFLQIQICDNTFEMFIFYRFLFKSSVLFVISSTTTILTMYLNYV